MDSRSGIIFPDGSLRFDGFEPLKWRLLAINTRTMVVHCPGSVWYDNGGSHYGPASMDIYLLRSLARGRKEGSWRFEAGSQIASFHPTPRTACENAAEFLKQNGDQLIQLIEKRKDQ